MVAPPAGSAVLVAVVGIPGTLLTAACLRPAAPLLLLEWRCGGDVSEQEFGDSNTEAWNASEAEGFGAG